MFVQKYVVSNDFIDLNGHLSEVGYYYYAVQTVWAINKELGLVEKYEEFSIGPIIFDTEIKFKKEVFHGGETDCLGKIVVYLPLHSSLGAI